MVNNMLHLCCVVAVSVSGKNARIELIAPQETRNKYKWFGYAFKLDYIY